MIHISVLHIRLSIRILWNQLPICLNSSYILSIDPCMYLNAWRHYRISYLSYRQAPTFEDSIANMLDTVGQVSNNQMQNMVGKPRLALQQFLPAFSAQRE